MICITISLGVGCYSYIQGNGVNNVKIPKKLVNTLLVIESVIAVVLIVISLLFDQKKQLSNLSPSSIEWICKTGLLEILSVVGVQMCLRIVKANQYS